LRTDGLVVKTLSSNNIIITGGRLSRKCAKVRLLKRHMEILSLGFMPF